MLTSSCPTRRRSLPQFNDRTTATPRAPLPANAHTGPHAHGPAAKGGRPGPVTLPELCVSASERFFLVVGCCVKSADVRFQFCVYTSSCDRWL
ncbi:hypothetical protein AVEN_252206-1 [Araneus ventricosus]|uniref:Uncharacterized protein n=1 Tax=Araneus ventricosus TaxID=182803 RepID=A0A4Y2BWI0_ARAVE|nr:hypothetical protein AVEN_252206-1 [Araneus ventricosus]